MLLDDLKQSADYIKSVTGDIKFDIAMVLGSGLGDMAETLGEVVYIPYSDIPHFPVSTVPGHKGRLAIGILEGKRVICMQGRFHYYEGYGLAEGAALHDLDTVSDLEVEACRCVNGVSGTPLLVSLVFLLVFQVVALYHDGVVHFDGRDGALDDLAPDGQTAVERAVGVLAFCLGRVDADSDVSNICCHVSFT